MGLQRVGHDWATELNWIVMLSIFSCTFWPSVSLPWRNVYLDLLHIQIFLFFCSDPLPKLLKPLFLVSVFHLNIFLVSPSHLSGFSSQILQTNTHPHLYYSSLNFPIYIQSISKCKTVFSEYIQNMITLYQLSWFFSDLRHCYVSFVLFNHLDWAPLSYNFFF